ncbi:hypothetical protein R3P38DRAFT_3231131 [Favolaschia claudopus]|uniref:Uncharacterized protein n=1 Tax=Favolaschia claudopus TaxID=2862362 RepID=A0AAV9ZKM8_9AGAR
MPPSELSVDLSCGRYPLQLNATYLATELPTRWPYDARVSSRTPSAFDACDQGLENDPHLHPGDRFLLRSATLNTTKFSSRSSFPASYLNAGPIDEHDSLAVSAFAERYLNMSDPTPVEVPRRNLWPIDSVREQLWPRLDTVFPNISEISIPTRVVEYAHHPELPSLKLNAAQTDSRSQRQALACYFCRGRKIACARPTPYSNDQTCK